MTPAEARQICSVEGQLFLREHRETPADRLLLSMHGRADPDLLRAAAEQIRCHSKFVEKQPVLAAAGGIVERSVLEQSTPQEVAAFRSTQLGGSTLCDCTGGLGIDTLALSNSFQSVTFCDLEESRTILFSYNARRLGVESVAIHHGDSMEFLRNSSTPFDWIFLDPARRNGTGRRFISLEESLPDVIANGNLLRSKGRNIALKLSPAFDLTLLKQQIPDYTSISVLSLRGEVREIFVTIEPYRERQNDRAVILGEHEPIVISDDMAGKLTVGTVDQTWLFEPDPAVIKAGLIDVVGRKFGLNRWSASGVFLLGNQPIELFPGRQFQIKSIQLWQRKEIGKYLKQQTISSAAVIRRDFPLSPEEIRSLYKLAESDSRFLIFTADSTGRRVCIDCRKWYQ